MKKYFVLLLVLIGFSSCSVIQTMFEKYEPNKRDFGRMLNKKLTDEICPDLELIKDVHYLNKDQFQYTFKADIDICFQQLRQCIDFIVQTHPDIAYIVPWSAGNNKYKTKLQILNFNKDTGAMYIYTYNILFEPGVLYTYLE